MNRGRWNLNRHMQFVSKDIDDACRKIAKVSNVGGAIYSVDDGRFVLYVGKKKLIKRAEFERYLLENVEI